MEVNKLPQRILDLSNEILDALLELRKKHPDFKFWVRQRNNSSKLDQGLWFQGSFTYVFVGLLNRSGGVNKTKSTGLVVGIDKENKLHPYLEIVFKGEEDEKILSFYKHIVERIGGFNKIDDEKYQKYFNTNDLQKALDEYLSKYKPIIDKVLEEDNLKDVLEIPDKDFKKSLQRVLNIRNAMGTTQNTQPVTIEKDSLNEPVVLNQILYGPPGTGKTYALKHCYLPQYVQEHKRASKEEFIKDIIINHTWWEVIGLILYKEGSMSVPEINRHQYLRIKHEASNNNNSATMIWAMLQMHTDPSSKNVQYSKRSEPYVFEKSDNSIWSINKELCKTNAPQIAELLDEIENYTEKEEKKENYTFTTFHQSFSYEDFIEGIKPVFAKEDNTESSIEYQIEKGVFYKCCDEACKLAGFLSVKDCIENYTKEERIKKFKGAGNYAIFIDEINRANVSAVFGELITLIEDDKRLSKDETIVELPYSKNKFAVPPNLHIIGTMNTADRSVEALDTALRRRFSFIEMPSKPELLSPQRMIWEFFWKYEDLMWDNEVYVEKEKTFFDFLKPDDEFKGQKRKDIWDNWAEVKDEEQIKSLNDVIFNGINLQSLLQTINERIEVLIDKDHTIGHSYFMKAESLQDLQTVFRDKIIPLLQEYFYGDFNKIGLVLGDKFIYPRNKPTNGLFAPFSGVERDIAGELSERKVFKFTESSNWSIDAFKSIYEPVENPKNESY